MKLLIRCFFCIAAWAPALSLSQSASSYQVRVKAELNRQQVPLNRTAVLKVTAEWLGAPDAIELLPVEPPVLTNLKIVSTATANRVEPQADGVRTQRIYEFTLQPERLGMAYVDEVRLTYREKEGAEHSLQTPRLQLEVIDPVPEPAENHIAWWAVLGVLLTALGAAGVWTNHRRRVRREEEERRRQQERSLEEIYLERLPAEISLTSDDLPAQYAKLAALLRGYLREKLQLEFAGTTEELLQRLEERDYALDIRTQIQKVLQACDVVKFSGASADPNQLARMYTLTEDLIRQKKVMPETPEGAEE